MGGNQSSECNAIVRQMGIWCIQKNIWPVNRCLAKDPGEISRGYTDNTPVAYTTVILPKMQRLLYLHQILAKRNCPILR
ncbi:Hypothetical predicted protein, partial [Paramuricea clavata]